METKKTNRNTRLIIVAIVLALVVLFLCIGGSTFARYIASKDAPSNQATVAKWGFVVNADVDDLFGENYNNTAIVTNVTDNTELDVAGSGNVVAPGTTGEMTFGVTGSAEVLARLDLDFTVTSEVTLTTGTGDDATVYSPLKWTLTQGASDVLVNGGTLADVKTELDTVSKTIEAGENVTDRSYTLSWEWALGEESDANNRLDTLLGYAANGAGTYGDVVVTVAGDVITVTDNADAENPVVYTAVTEVDFGLSIKVVQISSDERA